MGRLERIALGDNAGRKSGQLTPMSYIERVTHNMGASHCLTAVNGPDPLYGSVLCSVAVPAI
jgi:hypothetical protein